jgi:hypothetical protein
VETENAGDSIQSAELVVPRSFFSRLGGVYSSPNAAFQDVGRSPGVLMPMIALIIMGMLSTYLMSLKVDLGELQSKAVEQIAERQVAQGNMNQAQADQLKERAATRTGAGSVVSTIFAGLALVLMALVIAAIAKLISSTFLGAENTFKSLFSVSLYVALAVGIVHTFLFLMILFFKNPADLDVSNINSLVASNLGALLTGLLGEDALPRFLAKFLGWVDIFAIWKIALLSIGCAAVSRKLKTARAATWITAIYVVIALIAAAMPPIFGLG